jgi:hypothetical protein
MYSDRRRESIGSAMTAVWAWVDTRAVASALVIGAVLGVLSWISNLSLATAVLFVLWAFMAALWVFIALRNLREHTYPPPDYQRWDHVEAPTVWEAACLWCGESPHPAIPAESRSFACLRMLESALEAGRLESHPGTGKGTNARLRREDLTAFAEEIGERPPFLFPEERRGETEASPRHGAGPRG